MNCYEHPSDPAVIMCSRCGKGACRPCATDVGGAVLCRSCISQAFAAVQQQQHEEQVQAQAEVHQTVASGRKSIMRGWIIGGLFSLVFGPIAGIGLSQDPGVPGGKVSAVLLVPLLMAIYAYMGWALSWSIPVVWRWCRTAIASFVSNLGCGFAGGLAFWVVLLSCLISIPITVAVFYGMFGGAIYEYRKARRIVAEGSAALSAVTSAA